MSISERILRRLHLQVLGARDPMRPRIFGIGLSKTATTSLCDALGILGFKALHYAPVAEIDDLGVRLNWPWWVEDYDAMADLPVAVVFRQLAERFPTSTFILTVRDEEAWLASAEKHFNPARYRRASSERRFEQGLLLNKFAYGTNQFELEAFRSAFRQHNAEVRDFFAGHPRYFELDICGGDSWNEVCRIVNKPVPATPFPISNVHSGA